MLAWLFAVSLIVGDETPLGPPSTLVPAANRQYEATLAAAPHGFLAVWRDGRTETSDFGGEVYAARIAPNGEVLDPEGLRLMPKAHHNTRAVWSGSEWIVAANYDRDVVLSRVPASGGAPSAPVAIAKNETVVAIASNGESVLLLTRAEGLRARFLGTNEKAIELPERFATTNAIIRGRDYLFLFVEDGDYQLVTIRPNGSVRRRPLFYLDQAGKVAVADNGKETLLIVEHGRRLDAALIDLASPQRPRWGEIAELDRRSSSTSSAQEVIWDGETFRVFWESGRRIHSRRIARNGVPMSDTIDFAGGNTSTWSPHAVAASTNAWAVIWAGDNVSADEDILARTSSSGDAPILVSRGTTLQRTPALAGAGNELFAAVRERDQSGVIVAGRAPLTAASLRLPAGLVSDAAVASSNSETVAVWADPQALVGQRFDRAGRPVGERVVIDRICSDGAYYHVSPSTPTIASSGTSYIVAWLPCGPYYGTHVIHLNPQLEPYALVHAAPGPLQVATLVPPQPPRIWSPRAAWNGSEYLVAWIEMSVHGPLRVMRWKDRALEQVQSMPAAILDNAPISFAARGSEAVAAWVEYRSKNHELCIVAAGKALQCVPYEKDALSGAAVVATADDFFVAWSASRNGQLDIVGTFLGDPKPFPIAASPDAEEAPSLAIVGGEIVVGYTRRAAAANNVPRAFFRRISK